MNAQEFKEIPPKEVNFLKDNLAFIFFGINLFVVYLVFFNFFNIYLIFIIFLYVVIFWLFLFLVDFLDLVFQKNETSNYNRFISRIKGNDSEVFLKKLNYKTYCRKCGITIQYSLFKQKEEKFIEPISIGLSSNRTYYCKKCFVKNSILTIFLEFSFLFISIILYILYRILNPYKYLGIDILFVFIIVLFFLLTFFPLYLFTRYVGIYL